MACYHPQRVWYSRFLNSSGKRSIVFNMREALSPGDHFEIACGQCIGCRLERSRQWAMRCLHEAKLHKNNCFLTLTYDNDHVPSSGSLVKEDFQKFMKRYRKRFGKIRYYMCGEYGDKTGRPHFHACIFGHDFDDKKIYKTTRRGDRLYTSKSLEELWPFGHAIIGDVTFDSAAYVARYVMKKVTGKKALLHYNKIDLHTGELLKELLPEYTNMSLKPAVGKGWYERFGSYVQTHDFIIVNGKKVRPPKYYDRLFEKTRPYEFDDVKERRSENAKKHSGNNTLERLETREICHQLKIKVLQRNVD